MGEITQLRSTASANSTKAAAISAGLSVSTVFPFPSLGATLSGLVLDNVLVEGCKLYFATFTKVRAAGPVVFSKCTLTGATFTGCDPARAVIDETVLRRTGFEHGSYREVDLRSNDLSEVRGAGNLAKVILDRGQETELARALVTELEAVFGDDLDDPAPGRHR